MSGHVALTKIPYYSDKSYYTVTIKGSDLCGNVIFKDVKMQYARGDKFEFIIPQYDNYVADVYIDGELFDINSNNIEFCVETDTLIEILYRHLIVAHIDITDEDGKVVVCDNISLNIGEHDIDVPCVAECMTYRYELPTVDLYYSDVDFVDVTISEHIIVNNLYKKIKPFDVIYTDEYGTELWRETIDNLTEQDIKANHIQYEIKIDDAYKEDYYHYGDSIIDIALPTDDVTIQLIHYRYVKVNYRCYYNNEITDDTYYEFIMISTEKQKFQIDEIVSVSVPQSIYDDTYYTKQQDFTFKVDANYTYQSNYEIDVFIDYYKRIKVTVYCICNGTVIETETVTGLEQNKVYIYTTPTVSGYSSTVGILYIKDTKDKTLHIEFTKD
jgi:hypothetical protein